MYISMFIPVPYCFDNYNCIVVQLLSRVQLFATPQTACSSPGFPVLQCLPEFAQTHNHWIGDNIPTISSSLIPFSSHLQSFPASGSFPMSWHFASGAQSIGASTSASVLPMNIYGWFPLGLTGSISSLSKGLSRVFSTTTIRKHQYFGARPSLWPNSHIHTWLLEKP